MGSDARVALLARAGWALHEQSRASDQRQAGWLRRDVAKALELPDAEVQAEFADDQSLLTATITWLVDVHLRRQRTLSDVLATGDLPRWGRAALLQGGTPGPVFGCEIGWLARNPDIVGVDRDLLDRAYCAWQWQLTLALRRLQGRGLVSLDADLQRLAATVLSLLQGAYMTACRTHDLTPIEATCDAAALLITQAPGR